MQAVYGEQCVDVSTVRRSKDGELGFKNETPIFFSRTDFKKTSAALAQVKCVVILWKNN